MANKKSPAKKTTAKRKTVSKKSPVKKGKVAVSPAGVIVLCGIVIVICLGMLLATTISEKPVSIEASPIAERFSGKPQESKDHAASARPEKQAEKTVEKTQVSKAEKKSSEKKKISETPKKEPEKTAVNNTELQKQSVPQKTTEPKKPAVQETKPEVKEPEKTVQKETVKEPEKQTFSFPAAVNGAQLVLLLDDGGQNLSDLQKFLDLQIPVTVAVLPKLRDSVSSAKAVRASSHAELMLHQPMQAINRNVNPGPGAIKPEMSSSEIRSLMFENLQEIGPVAGINNHEGSLITADIMKMETIIDVAHMNGLYFLDSRTNVDTKIPYVSRELGYGWYERNGNFLDNEKTRAEFLKELRKNLDIANKSGCVIMIAHVWSANYMPALIREVYPELVAKGYTFKTVGNCRGLKH